jgi:hypothetical protein
VYIANVYDHHEVEKLKGREQVQQHSLEPYKKSVLPSMLFEVHLLR